MIVILTTPAHDYTHRLIEGSGRFDFRRMHYGRALTQRRLPRATYIFSDLDRLNFWELELAAKLYRRLEAAGLRVLNDPARVRLRFSLLRALRERGLNDFDAWRVEDPRRPAPEQYPVFLRTESAHRGTLGDLVETPEALEAAIGGAIDRGLPRRELIIVQYRAEPLRPGLFRKLAAFRIGDRTVTALAVHESRWSAKYGEPGIAGEDFYDDEYELVRENRYGDALLPAFETACIDYGRADFAMVGGRPQVYEINTNPNHGRVREHPFPIRLETDRLFQAALLDAFAAIDTPEAGGSVEIRGWPLSEQRRRDRWMLQPRWTP